MIDISITLVDVYLNRLNCFHFLNLEVGLFFVLIDCMIFLSLFLDLSAYRMFPFGL